MRLLDALLKEKFLPFPAETVAAQQRLSGRGFRAPSFPLLAFSPSPFDNVRIDERALDCQPGVSP
jgi:hypothetical protein